MKSIPSVRPGPWSIVPFFLGGGCLFSLIALILEFLPSVAERIPNVLVLVAFLLGAGVGILLNRWWKKSEGNSFESFFILSLSFFSVSTALLGAFAGMFLGYWLQLASTDSEMLMLVSGMLGSAFGAYLGYFLLGGDLGPRGGWAWAAIAVGLLLEVFLEQFESISPVFAPLILMLPAFGLLLVHFWGRSRK